MTNQNLQAQEPVALAIRLTRTDHPIQVQAEPADPGLYVYELPDFVNYEDPYRWRIGHHTGLAIAIATTKDEARAGAEAIADLTDWTKDADAIVTSLPGIELKKRLRRKRCYRAGY